jgi:hypothetical protein
VPLPEQNLPLRELLSTGPSVVPAGIEGGIETISVGGSPLPIRYASLFEPHFGYDFGGVRMHTGRAAAGAAACLRAYMFFSLRRHHPQDPTA